MLDNYHHLYYSTKSRASITTPQPIIWETLDCVSCLDLSKAALSHHCDILMEVVEQVFGLKKKKCITINSEKCITLNPDQEEIGHTVRKGVFGPQLKYVVD